MIKNVKVKKFLINVIFPTFSILNKIIKKNESIIFIHSANGELNDNSLAVFEYLIEEKYNCKYKIICSVSNVSKYSNKEVKNVCFIKNNYKSIIQFLRSKFVFYSMGKIPIIPTKNQMVINLWHGIPLKTIGLLSNINNGKEFYFNYVCASSDFYKPIMAKAFGCPEKNVVICGEPKTDKLFIAKNEKEYKLIVWAPTFRKSKFLGYNDVDRSDVLPIFNNFEFDILNNMLKKLEVFMIVKLHPLQDLGEFCSCHLSNLKIYSHDDFLNEGLELYSLLSKSDALITDYSSIGLEYMVLNRPIAYSIDDIEDYKDNRGFVVNDPLKLMPGKLITDKESFETFVHDVANSIDEYSEVRNNINILCNKYRDGKNTERILKIAGIKK